MTRRRWIADEFSDNRAALIGNHAAHLARVLRVRVGQEFDVLAGGRLHRGVITTVTDDRVEFRLGEELVAPPSAEISVLLSVFKFDRMEWAIEKIVELGVSRIVPVIARRTAPHLASAAARRVERWRRLAHESAQQSRRATIPEIPAPQKLQAAIQSSAPIRVVLAENEEQRSLKEAIGDSSGPLALAFGPEGGWTEDELKLFSDAGWIGASLGPTILRAETAAIAAVAIAASELARD